MIFLLLLFFGLSGFFVGIAGTLYYGIAAVAL